MTSVGRSALPEESRLARPRRREGRDPCRLPERAEKRRLARVQVRAGRQATVDDRCPRLVYAESLRKTKPGWKWRKPAGILAVRRAQWSECHSVRLQLNARIAERQRALGGVVFAPRVMPLVNAAPSDKDLDRGTPIALVAFGAEETSRPRKRPALFIGIASGPHSLTGLADLVACWCRQVLHSCLPAALRPLGLPRRAAISCPVRLGVRRLPGVVSQAVSQLARLHAMLCRLRGAPLPFVAYGRNGFSLEHSEPADLATTWEIFCAHTYRVPGGARTRLRHGSERRRVLGFLQPASPGPNE